MAERLRPVAATGLAPAFADEDASVRPGATADTSAAMPALSAAVPTITQRRVRRTRSSAASRSSAARDRSEPEGGLEELIRLSIVPSLSGESVSPQ